MPVVINVLYFNIFLLIVLISEAIAKTVQSGTRIQHSFPVQKLLSNVEFRTLFGLFLAVLITKESRPTEPRVHLSLHIKGQGKAAGINIRR